MSISEATPIRRSQPGAFILDSRPEGDAIVVLGEVDIANAHDFDSSLQRALRRKKTLTVDLRQCTYFDSAGIKVLWKHDRRARLRVLTCANSTIERILKLTRDLGPSEALQESAPLLP